MLGTSPWARVRANAWARVLGGSEALRPLAPAATRARQRGQHSLWSQEAEAGGQGSGTSASLRPRGSRLGSAGGGLLLAGGSKRPGGSGEARRPSERCQHQDRTRCDPQRERGRGALPGEDEGLPDVISPWRQSRGMWAGECCGATERHGGTSAAPL